MKPFAVFAKLILIIVILFNKCVAQTPIFYGMTNEGGSNGYGAIIRFNPTNDSVKLIWTFGS